jgi:hypothetical protein
LWIAKKNSETGGEIMDIGDETPWCAMLSMYQERGTKQYDLHVVNNMGKVEVRETDENKK